MGLQKILSMNGKPMLMPPKRRRHVAFETAAPAEGDDGDPPLAEDLHDGADLLGASAASTTNGSGRGKGRRTLG